MQQNTLVSPEDVAEQGLRQICSGDAGASQIDGHVAAPGGDFGLYLIVAISRKNEQTSLGAGVLDCHAHERIDQLLEDDLARYRFRHLDHGPEVEVFHRFRDRGWREGRDGLIAWLRVGLIQLSHLALRPPAPVGITRVPQIRLRECCEAASRIKPRRQFESQRLLLGEPVAGSTWAVAAGVALSVFAARRAA